MKLKDFRFLEKKVDALERKMGNYEIALREERKEVKLADPAQTIHDRKGFKKWFKNYRLLPSEQLHLPLDELVLWAAFKERVLDNPYVKCLPLITSDGRSPQMEFLLCSAREVFYGGACGGGKTVALLAGALQYVNHPGYSALLLRRRLTDLSLPDSLLDLAHQWLDGSDVRFDSKNSTFIFPSGARLVFGYCDRLGDEQRYRSAQFQYIGVDELTQWDESQYLFLFSRLRGPKSLGLTCRMRCASNPGDVGHNWVKQRFIVEAKYVDGRVFIPAKLCDNPMLDQEDYRGSLMNLDPIRRAQILDGNWEINPYGRIFQRAWFSFVDDYPQGGMVVRCWDKAATKAERGKDPDWTAGVKMTKVNGVFYVIHVVRFRETPRQNEIIIRQTAEMDGTSVRIYMEEEPGSSGKGDIFNYSRVLEGFFFKGERNTGSKELNASPLSSAAQAGNVKLVRGPWNQDFLDEFESFPMGTHDDQIDAAAHAFKKLNEYVPLGGTTVERVLGG